MFEPMNALVKLKLRSEEAQKLNIDPQSLSCQTAFEHHRLPEKQWCNVKIKYCHKGFISKLNILYKLQSHNDLNLLRISSVIALQSNREKLRWQ